jgi:hypothetical protein
MKRLLLACLAIVAVAGVVVPAPAFAVDSYEACKYQPNSAPCQDKTPANAKNAVAARIGRILNVVYGIAGILAVGFIVYAGIRYVTAAGQPEKVRLAQKQLTYAIVGLVVSIAAFAITSFVIGRIT